LGSAASNIDATNKYAWSTNAGWVNFSPANGGVTVATDHLEGYAWAENIGWLKLGTYTGGGSHTYSNTSATDYGVNRDAAGNLSGYAWGTNVGWIKFNPTNGGATVNQTTGRFDGYAWSENVGWIHFHNASPAYTVQTGTSNVMVTSSTPPLPDYLGLFLQVDGTGHGKVTTDTGLSCQSSDCQVDKAGDLKCNPQNCTQLEKTGSDVTLTPQADADSVFSSWGGNEDCVDGNVFMNGGKLCIAYFHRIYSLTVAAQGPGQVTGYGDYNQQPIIDCGSKCQTSVSDGTRVSLQATPSQGMTFSGWSGDCGNNTQNPLRVEVNKEMKCQATFITPVVTTTPMMPTTPVTTSPVVPTTPVVTLPPTSKSEDLDSSTKVVTPPAVTTGNVPTITPTPPAMPTTPEVSTTPPVETTPTTIVTTPPVDTTPATVVTSPVVLTPPVDLTPPTPPPVVAVTPPPVTAPLLVETYYPLVIIAANFNCQTTGNIDEICNYGGQEVTNLNVQGHGIVSNGLLNTTVVNTGWVSNFHITATGKLSGGVVTGYIMNEGIMRDFEFVGMSIIGGTLGGVITNTSKVGGYFQDVTLLPNTKITGGILSGIITGDKNAPAVLENVRVKGRSKLSGVKLGKNVKLEKGVLLEK
jgi:hypothetical protein